MRFRLLFILMFGSFQILIGQGRVEKTFILQRTIFQRNLFSYIDSIAPVFLALHGVPNDTVSVTFNYNKSRRIYILNEDGFDTVVISRGNHVMSLIYDVYSDLPLSIGDTPIFNNSITVSSKYEIKLKSFSKGVNQLNYLDTGQNWPIDSDKNGSYTLTHSGYCLNTSQYLSNLSAGLNYTAFSIYNSLP